MFFKKVGKIIYVVLTWFVLMGCSVDQDKVIFKKTKVEKLKELGKAKIIEKAIKIIGNKIDVRKFEYVEVSSTKKNLYVRFYNSIGYLPLGKTYTVSTVVNMLTGYSRLNTFSNIKGKKVPFYSESNAYDLKSKEVNSPKALKLVIDFINNAIEVKKSTSNSYPFNTLTLLNKLNTFEEMPMVLETKESYQVEIVTSSYDMLYTVSKDKGLVENFVLGSIATKPMRDETN